MTTPPVSPPDAQIALDGEDALRWRAEVRVLRLAVQATQEKEEEARSACKEAVKARREAQDRLSAKIQADAVSLPIFDWAARQQQTNGQTPAPAAPAEPPKAHPALTHDMLRPDDPGAVHLADLIVRGQRARLWLGSDGRHLVMFDSRHFGNWSDPTLDGKDYWPTDREVAVAAGQAAGYPLTSALDWSETAPDLWRMAMSCAPENHPCFWRTLSLSFLPVRWVQPLYTAGVKTLGGLAALIEHGGGLASVRGLSSKDLVPLMDAVRQWVAGEVNDDDRAKLPAYFRTAAAQTHPEAAGSTTPSAPITLETAPHLVPGLDPLVAAWLETCYPVARTLAVMFFEAQRMSGTRLYDRIYAMLKSRSLGANAAMEAAKVLSAAGLALGEVDVVDGKPARQPRKSKKTSEPESPAPAPEAKPRQKNKTETAADLFAGKEGEAP